MVISGLTIRGSSVKIGIAVVGKAFIFNYIWIAYITLLFTIINVEIILTLLNADCIMVI